MIIKTLAILLVSLFCYSNLMAVKFEFTQYKYSDGKTLLELNYQMNVSNLLFKNNENNNLVSNTKLGFVVSAVGVENINQKWMYQYEKITNDSNLVIFDKKYYSLYPGKYNFKFFYNYGDAEIIENVGEINIKDFSKPHTEMSDILLAHQLEDFDSTKHNKLFKRGELYIIPNVEHTISGAYPYLKHYFELYNIDLGKGNKIDINYKVITGTKKEVVNISKVKTINSQSIYDFGMIPIDSLQNGLYHLVVDINKNDELLTTNSVKFYILDPKKDFFISDKFEGSLSFERSPFAIMDINNIEYEFNTMKVILSEFEIEKYESLTTLRAKQRAIYSYWNERDIDTTTAINEKFTAYKERISFANKYFSRGDIMPGWKTERGRVLLKYGFPTNREIFRSRGERKAAEEWQYDELYGGAYFFFIDRFGDNSFLLVHTNTPGEVKNYNWFDEFNPAIDNDGSPRYNNSRNIDK